MTVDVAQKRDVGFPSNFVVLPERQAQPPGSSYRTEVELVTNNDALYPISAARRYMLAEGPVHSGHPRT